MELPPKVENTVADKEINKYRELYEDLKVKRKLGR